MREGGHNFFDVMSDKNEGGGVGPPGKPVEELKEAFASNGVESGAGFVEDEYLGFYHQCSANKDTLAFAL